MERTPHGQIPGQPLITCLLREHLGQSPNNGEAPTPTFAKTEKAEDRTPPRLAAIPHAMINKPPQGKAEEKCGWGLHCLISTKPPLTQRVKVQKTGTARDKTTSKGTTTPKALDILQHMTFLMDSPNSKSREGMEWENGTS